MNEGNWVTHCDTELRTFESEAEATGHAISEIATCRRERSDGWDEELVESIVVMRVVARAQKVDPDVDYRAVDYHLVKSPSEEDVLLEALRESLSLQSHYAGLLNGWDGGERRQFASISEWLARLAECKALGTCPTIAAQSITR